MAQLDNLPGGLGARRGLFLPGGRPSPGGLGGGDRRSGWGRRRRGVWRKRGVEEAEEARTKTRD